MRERGGGVKSAHLQREGRGGREIERGDRGREKEEGGD